MFMVVFLGKQRDSGSNDSPFCSLLAVWVHKNLCSFVVNPTPFMSTSFCIFRICLEKKQRW